MKKMIIILFLMSSFFINVCIVNAETKEELEKKYEIFSKLVEQDIEFIKSKINLDYNGGFGVYPNDITSSNNLTYATTY